MQEELRKHETTLLISGMADVAFGAWSLIKAVLYVFLNKKELMEQLPEDANGPIIYVVIAAAGFRRELKQKEKRKAGDT